MIKGGQFERRNGKSKTIAQILGDKEFNAKGLTNRNILTVGPFGSGFEHQRANQKFPNHIYLTLVGPVNQNNS